MSTYTVAATSVTHNVGSVAELGPTAYESVQGNQPDGTVSLVYTCESFTVYPTSLTVSYVGSGFTANFGNTITVVGATLSLYQYVRIENKYYQVSTIESSFAY